MKRDREEKSGHQISKWQKADAFVIAVLLFGGLFFLMYKYYVIMAFIGFIVLLILFFSRSLYDKDIERSKLFKRTAILLRAVGYTVVAISVIIPFTMGKNWKWYYPIQKMVYGTNDSADNFLPDKIPDNAENYEVIFCRAAFPGASRVEISFFTDGDTLDMYRSKAIRNCASNDNENVAKSRWYHEMEAQGVPYENAEYYFYPDATEHFPKVYILEESTGYVKIYY